MKDFTTSKASGLIVSVPEGSSGFRIEMHSSGNGQILYWNSTLMGIGGTKSFSILPLGNRCTFLGLSHELTEQEKEQVVGEHNGLYEYPDYMRHELCLCVDINSSFSSLLLSLGLDPKENYAILINDKK